ncbi:MAG: hypothetical protein KDC10_01855 [Calditrichaeota bacterium]|nr:hypothetical protein [Calditrichota bacterium]MCB9472686.1 hypothetical protein [Candidatus Delongbacteria bacterium]
MTLARLVPLVPMLLLLLGGCGGGDEQTRYDTGPVMSVSEGIPAADVWREAGFDVVSTPPGPLEGTTASMGGAGFEEIAGAEGWQTRTDYHSDGSPEAVPGGQIRVYISDYPATIRTEGKDTHNVNNSLFRRMQFETLLRIDSETLEYIPGLASHWKVVDREDGGQDLYFRINPAARWQTGHRVTAEDVIATWGQRVDQGMLFPADELTFKEFERPVALSPYIVRTSIKDHGWRRFMAFATEMWIYPSHIIAPLTGKEFIEQYQRKPLPGSGNYLLKEEDLKPPNSLTFTRVSDYWDKDNPGRVGQWNFARIKMNTINEETLTREKFKKGELDVYYVNQSKYWVKELVPESVHQLEQGWIQKKEVYNKVPGGMQGHFFNMRKPPFNDLRARQAIAYLNNREQMIDKLFYNAYVPANSAYPGTDFECLENEQITFNPQKAIELLAEAGWKERNDEGWLVNDKGEVFEVEIMFDGTPSAERVHTVFQENWKAAGIRMILKSTTWATQMQMMDSRNFTAYYGAWTGSLFPDPSVSWHSKYADIDNSNNFTGLRNARVDSLCDVYEITPDINVRIGQLREIDRLLAQERVGAYAWYGPSSRIAHWNKFGMPEGVLNKTEDWRRLMRLWWYDADKHRALDTAIRKDQPMDLPSFKAVRYWLEH